MHYVPNFNISLFRCIESINMAVSNLVEKMKRHTVLMALTANHNPDIASFLKVAMRNDRWLCVTLTEVCTATRDV